MLLKLAVLNIVRSPRRSLFTVLAISVGLAALIFLWGFSDGTTDQQRENVIHLFTGHAQIHAKGFEDKLAPEMILPDAPSLARKAAADPAFVANTERVKTQALIGTTENSRGILLLGIDPLTEPKVTKIHQFVKEGQFLQADDDKHAVIGYRLAEKMGIKIGDKVVLMTQAIDGTLAGFSYRVKGTLKTGSLDLDELTAYITIKSARELLDIADKSHEIVILLNGQPELPGFLKRAKGWIPETCELLTWDKIIPEVNQWSQWGEAIIRTMMVAVMSVIAVGIMNTILMSVYERTREFGVMIAIGTSPKQIIALVLLETFFLEFVGILVGLGAGYLITSYFGHAGIAFHGLEEAFSSTYMSTVTYPKVKAGHVVQSVLTLIMVTTFVGIYPAWKAGRMEPVKAIYQFR